MADHTAIAEVGRSFVDLLRDRMRSPPRAGDPDPEIKNDSDVQLGSPDRIDGARLSVFLYRVEENPHTTNDRREHLTPQADRPAPLELDLYYLVTAYPVEGDDETVRSEDQHTVLGRVMQIVRDEGALRDTFLEGSLAGGPELPIAPAALPIEDVTNVWSTFDSVTYQPSVSYVIGPVAIDSLRETASNRVTKQRTTVGHRREEQSNRETEDGP